MAIKMESFIKKLVPWGTDGRLHLSDLDLDRSYGQLSTRYGILGFNVPLDTGSETGGPEYRVVFMKHSVHTSRLII